ncbi:uncharacterized protein F4812DRAFT_289984 [Daldinia caldariorum]|uniref:uncharacterized protein n=1 Tax=Daldinia caldariorum TaxID=326644 RepID=UPI002007248A|nr:uncharacterized protein F4812DRAFT_289984 [Daldinia caldariorum]KAI1463023.1 hypothetical protein F4812DRAFT_289984 [Daldinia caldariorum]
MTGPSEAVGKQPDKTKVGNTADENAEENAEDELIVPERFSPEEEANLLGESNEKKSEANALFASGRYESAITKYEEAASVCPHYFDYELAVIKSNLAACYLKLEQWKEAIKPATESIDGLDRLEKAEAKQKESEEKQKNASAEDDEVEEEIVSSGAQKSAPAAKEEDSAEAARQKRHNDILRIRAKALMRRARARSELGGWSNLAGAEEDYKLLSAMTNLSAADRKIVQTQLLILPSRTKAAQEKEMAEMWGKLKDLGNGILKPFGLSTENFKMVKDEKTGGYSMNFSQNGAN